MDRLPAPPLPDRIQRQLPQGITRYAVDLGDVTMHVMEQGQGRPVLCVHGNPTWSFLYRKVFAALAGEPVRLIAPDLIGLGLSSRVPTAQHQLATHGAWMQTLVRGLDLQDAVFVGQDWGGPIGALGFVPEPDRLTGAVILNTVIGPPKPGFKPTAFHRFAHTRGLSDLAFRLGGYPQRALHQAQGDPRSIQGEVAHAYRWPLRGLRRNAAPLAMARMVPDTPAHPSIPALQQVADLFDAFRGPAAIVWGDKDPILGRVRSHIERTLPQARVWRSEAGHFLQEEVPDTIAEAIRHVCATT